MKLVLIYLYTGLEEPSVVLVRGRPKLIKKAIKDFKTMIDRAYDLKLENKPMKLSNGHEFIPDEYSVEDLIKYFNSVGIETPEYDVITETF